MGKKLDVYLPSASTVCEEGSDPRGMWLEVEEEGLVGLLTTLAKARRFYNDNSEIQEFVICIPTDGDSQ